MYCSWLHSILVMEVWIHNVLLVDIPFITMCLMDPQYIGQWPCLFKSLSLFEHGYARLEDIKYIRTVGTPTIFLGLRLQFSKCFGH